MHFDFQNLFLESITVLSFDIISILLVKQLAPVNPATQSQTKPFTWSVQVPPFTQGLLSHSSISERQEEKKYSKNHKHTLV